MTDSQLSERLLQLERVTNVARLHVNRLSTENNIQLKSRCLKDQIGELEAFYHLKSQVGQSILSRIERLVVTSRNVTSYIF